MAKSRYDIGKGTLEIMYNPYIFFSSDYAQGKENLRSVIRSYFETEQDVVFLPNILHFSDDEKSLDILSEEIFRTLSNSLKEINVLIDNPIHYEALIHAIDKKFLKTNGDNSES